MESNSPPQSFRPNAVLTITVLVGIVGAVYLRTMFLGFDLWLDEAWLANSIRVPTLSGMFYFDRFVQTAPPLFLLIERAFTGIVGSGEFALRFLPWVAGLSILLAMAGVLRKLYSFPLVLIGVTLAAANYDAIKYAQQVKQYSSDLLLSCLLFALLWSYMTQKTQGTFWTLCLLCSAGVFLSFPAIFFLPVSAIIVLIGNPVRFAAEPRKGLSIKSLRDTVILTVVSGVSVALVLYFFVLPNSDANLTHAWRNGNLGSGGVLRSLGAFAHNVSELLLPGNGPLMIISYGLVALCGVGAIRVARDALRKDDRATKILLVVFLPIATAMVASFARKYPVLRQSRFIIWMLPGVYVLLLYALEPAWLFAERTAQRLSPASGRSLLTTMLAIGCVLTVFATIVFLKRDERSREEVGVALSSLKKQIEPREPLYVYGALEQQADYYMENLHWRPVQVYLGVDGWPCCPRNKWSRVSNPKAMTFEDDVVSFLQSAENDKVSVLLPSGKDPRHFTQFMKRITEQFPQFLSSHGWKVTVREEFKNAVLFRAARS